MKTNTIIYLIFILLAVSCSTKSKQEKQIKEQLSGEWELINDKSNEEVFSYRSFGYAFSNDSIEFFNGSWKMFIDSITGRYKSEFYGNFTKYDLQDSNIFILSLINGQWEFKWKFINRLNDTLTLAVDDTTILKFKKLQYNTDTVPSFDQIIYSSTGCYGTCPVVDVSIDIQGNVLFQGEIYVDKIGLFEGKLDDGTKKYVFNKFMRAEPLKLSKSYEANHTDDESIITTYIKNGKIVKTIHDYGRMAPSELTWAYIPIANLYRIMNLTALPDEEDPLLRSYTLVDGQWILQLQKSESFYLWMELKKSKQTNQDFHSTYRIAFSENYTYWEYNPNKKDHKLQLKTITTDGQLYKFEYSNAPSVTYDLEYNFIERNFDRANFIKLEKGREWILETL